MNMKWIAVAHLVSAISMIAIPIGLAIYLHRRFQKSWNLWWIGGATFIASQAGHLPFNIAVDLMFKRQWLPAPPKEWALIFNAVFLGLSAGMWESWFRWIAYRWWAKKARSWQSGILLGAGHGGAEAILLGLLSLYTLLNIWVLTGQNLFEIYPAEQAALAQRQLTEYWSQPWYLPLLGTAERVFTIIFHIAASLLVLQAFLRNQILWVWLTVLWHALMDGFFAVYLSGAWQDYPWRYLAIEGLLGILAGINLIIIFSLKQPEPPGPGLPTPPSAPIKPKELSPVKEPSEDLDRTRYYDAE